MIRSVLIEYSILFWFSFSIHWQPSISSSNPAHSCIRDRKRVDFDQYHHPLELYPWRRAPFTRVPGSRHMEEQNQRCFGALYDASKAQHWIAVLKRILRTASDSEMEGLFCGGVLWWVEFFIHPSIYLSHRCFCFYRVLGQSICFHSLICASRKWSETQIWTNEFSLIRFIVVVAGVISISITFFNKAVFAVYDFKAPNMLTFGQIVFSIIFMWGMKNLGWLDYKPFNLEMGQQVRLSIQSRCVVDGRNEKNRIKCGTGDIPWSNIFCFYTN